MSSVFRFQSSAAIENSTSVRVLRKRKLRKDILPVLVAADSSQITDKNGTRPICSFRELDSNKFITLTRREADNVALANPGVRPPEALEAMHPWLPRMSYVCCSKANFRSLNSIIKKYGDHLVSAAAFCDVKWNTICNSVRAKNDLDARFYTAWHLPIQDAFVLEETRPDRTVIALDFNGMYASCMQQPFPRPSALRLARFDRDVEPDEYLPIGLYRCVLKTPTTDFIQKYNPFRSFFSGRQLQATLTEPIEIDLNEFEVHFFRKHFMQVHLVDAVICDQSIAHPLAREVLRSFARRRHYQAQGNKPLADREKYLSTLMSSCSQRPNRSRFHFASSEAASLHLSAKYGIRPNKDEPDSASENWRDGRKGVVVADTADGLFVEAPETQDGSACFIFNQRIVARARIELLEMMETISVIVPGVEICYANIDSIHFSVPTVKLGDTLEHLRDQASEELGSFKIEAVTQHGLWLEPGRYWLYADNVEKFKNRSVGDGRNPFKDHSIHVLSQEISGLHIPMKLTVRMDNSMSTARAMALDIGTGIIRQRLIEIGDQTSFSDVLDQLEDNRKLSNPQKMKAFYHLKHRLGFA